MLSDIHCVVVCFSLVTLQEIWVRSLGQEDPLEKRMATHSNILGGEFHGQRSLADYSPWGSKESDTSEQLTLTFKIFNEHKNY